MWKIILSVATSIVFLLMLPFASGMLLSVVAGIWIFLFAMPFIPKAIDSLLIDPNRNRPAVWPQANVGLYPKSRRGFFSKLYPGQVKAIEGWNGRFIDMIMNWQGKHFIGMRPTNTYDRNYQEYWKVVDSGSLPDAHPLPFQPGWVAVALFPLYLLWWAWTRWVYWLTGAVWIGIPGFRTVHIYRLERYKKKTGPDGRTEWILYVDWSDHVRVADFQTHVLVPEMDTSNLVEVKGEFNQINRVTNPYLVFYNTDDDWMTRLMGAITAGALEFSRPRPHTEVIAAKDATGAGVMALFITISVLEKVLAIGLDASDTQVLDISPTDSEVAKALAEPARAEADRQAANLRAEGNAASIRESGKALRTYPEAHPIALAEIDVRIAEAAGDRAMIFLGGDKRQHLDAAQIKQLRELNENLGRRGPAQPSPQGGA